jgi:hypothetical protein
MPIGLSRVRMRRGTDAPHPKKNPAPGEMIRAGFLGDVRRGERRDVSMSELDLGET